MTTVTQTAENDIDADAGPWDVAPAGGEHDTAEYGNGRDAGLVRSWTDGADGDVEPDDATSLALWEGDTGELTAAQRRTFVALLKNRFITADGSPSEWRVLTEAEPLLRSRLGDLFLDLHIDRARGVAFKRQARSDAGDTFPTLLHDTAWRREETVLAVYLRMKFRSERAAGAADVIVDRADLLAAVQQFRPEHATDISGDAKKAANAIEALRTAGLLTRTPDEERLKISPVIEVLLSLEKLQELRDSLRELTTSVDGPTGDAGNETEGQ